MSAEQIRVVTGLSKTDYDSARKRMRRAQLRGRSTRHTKFRLSSTFWIVAITV